MLEIWITTKIKGLPLIMHYHFSQFWSHPFLHYYFVLYPFMPLVNQRANLSHLPNFKTSSTQRRIIKYYIYLQTKFTRGQYYQLRTFCLDLQDPIVSWIKITNYRIIHRYISFLSYKIASVNIDNIDPRCASLDKYVLFDLRPMLSFTNFFL
jgi:hypothetical protein